MPNDLANTHALDASAPLLDVALAPSALEARTEMPLPARTVYIVVDVVRATSTLSVLMERGAECVYVAGSIAQARGARQSIQARAEHERATAVLLAGEAGGIAPAGFDYGNSPAEFARADLAGKALIFATTNGTRALVTCAGGAYVLAGALRNARAVADAAVTLMTRSACAPNADGVAVRYTDDVGSAPEAASEAFVSPNHRARAAVVIVCAGRGGLPAYDDTVCAGVIAARVQARLADEGQPARTGEGARIALAAAAEAQRAGMRAALAASDAGRAVVEVGLAEDLDWCAATDSAAVVPRVAGATDDGLLLVRRWKPAQE